MKTKLGRVGFPLVIGLLAVICGSSATAQTPSGTSLPTPSDYVCAQRGPQSRLLQYALVETNQFGVVRTNLHSYTEMATGLCYLQNGQYVDSVEEVDPVPSGAQAIQGRHQVQWSLNANTPGGAVTLATPDGKQLLSTVFGMAYYDVASGSNAAIARLQNCNGAIVAPNQVVYAGAFSNVTADLQYTYRKAGLSQDIVLRQAPPAPDRYGLSDETTVFQVYTEFFNPPQPEMTTVTNGNVFDDQVLDFGDMKMLQGQALFLNGQDAPVSAGMVAKQWANVDGRTFLIESIPYPAISNQLQQLPQASNLKPGRGSIRRTALLESNPSRPGVSPKEARPMKVARTDRTQPRLMMDYEVLSISTNNVTFKGDTTYYISGPLNLGGTNLFEGGAVIKYSNNASLNLLFPAQLTCLGTNYRPTVFTAQDDDSVGDIISNSTHTPSGYYANPAIYFTGSPAEGTSFSMNHFRISYAEQAIYTSGVSVGAQLGDGQIINCAYGFTTSNNATTRLENMLFDNFYTALTLGYDNILSAINVTFYGGEPPPWYFSELVDLSAGTPVTAYLQNCIVADVLGFSGFSTWQITGDHNGFYDSGQASTYWYTNTWFGTSAITNVPAFPFQTVGAGSFYLTNGCPFTNAGTNNIDPALLADLQSKTTHPPNTNYINVTITTNLELSPQVPRDNNGATVDLGYHYDPIDYAVSMSVTAGTVTVSTGTVLAITGLGYGVYLNPAGNLNCQGTATSPNYIVSYNTVQEQSNTSWEGPGAYVEAGTSGSVNFRFTDWTALGRDSVLYTSAGGDSPVSFQDCQFYNGHVNSYPQSLTSTNCLYQRVNVTLDDYNVSGIFSTFYNNLFLEGDLTLTRGANRTNYIGGTWTFRDNLFDQTSVSVTNMDTNYDNPIYVCSHNAYVTTNSGTIPPTNQDVFLTTSPVFETGTLGQYYYATNTDTELIGLIHTGSQYASNAGLYHYTVTADNAVEGTNRVSIGFHYVACGLDDLPLDSNGDGVPDYLEDANGDGIVDDGETNWALAILSQPMSQTGCQGENATFTALANGVAPISYQWQFNGANIAWATTNTCTITNVQAANGGIYAVVVSNFSGSITSAVATLSTSLTNTAYITDGLVAYWKLNDGTGTSTAVDSSGNNIGLPLEQSPSWETNNCGAVDLVLNGSTQYGDVAGSFFTGQNNLDTTSLTICAWINKTGSFQNGIVNRFASNGGGWSFQVESDNQLEWYIGGPNLTDTGPASVPFGEWTFVAVAWYYSPPSGDEVNYYINGVLNSTVSANASTEGSSSGADLQVGNIFTGTNYAFEGSMHDIAIYNRLLSPADIASNFVSSQFTANVPFPDLLYYKMTEYPDDYQFSLTDSSTRGHTPGYALGTNWEWTNNVASLPNTALHFHGVPSIDNYIDTSNSTLFNFTTNLFTINLWVEPTSSWNHYLMQNQESSGTNGWYLYYDANYNVVFGTVTNGVPYTIQTSGHGAQNGTWDMVTVVRPSLTNAIIYVNGSEVVSGHIMSSSSSASTLKLAVDPMGTNFYDGNLWLIQMWSTNLPASSVANLYCNQLSGIPWP